MKETLQTRNTFVTFNMQTEAVESQMGLLAFGRPLLGGLVNVFPWCERVISSTG